MIVNNYCVSMISAMITAMITMVGVIMIVSVYTYCHYCKSSKIGWINRIVIGRIIGHVYG